MLKEIQKILVDLELASDMLYSVGDSPKGNKELKIATSKAATEKALEGLKILNMKVEGN